jgi:hypothetical protein
MTLSSIYCPVPSLVFEDAQPADVSNMRLTKIVPRVLITYME